MRDIFIYLSIVLPEIASIDAKRENLRVRHRLRGVIILGASDCTDNVPRHKKDTRDLCSTIDHHLDHPLRKHCKENNIKNLTSKREREKEKIDLD